MTFVTSFAIGLGPVPFVLISEVAPPHVSKTFKYDFGMLISIFSKGYFGIIICWAIIEL